MQRLFKAQPASSSWEAESLTLLLGEHGDSPEGPASAVPSARAADRPWRSKARFNVTPSLFARRGDPHRALGDTAAWPGPAGPGTTSSWARGARLGWEPFLLIPGNPQSTTCL